MEFYETHQEFKPFECFQCNVFSADTHANEESSADILTNEEETKIENETEFDDKCLTEDELIEIQKEMKMMNGEEGLFSAENNAMDVIEAVKFNIVHEVVCY